MYWYMEHEAREHLNTCLTFGLFGFELRSLRSNRFVVRVCETLGMAGFPQLANRSFQGFQMGENSHFRGRVKKRLSPKSAQG
jgi:hypothetical protein